MNAKIKEIKTNNFPKLDGNFRAVITKTRLYWIVREAYESGKKHETYLTFKDRVEEIIDKIRKEERKRLRDETYREIKRIRKERNK